jgi:FAD/FMN-containing dehydrogenase
MNEKEGQLVEIVGLENVLDDTATLETYSRDQSFVLPMKPRVVVKPDNADQVQKIVQWANQTQTPLVPVSSGPPHSRGDTIPSTTDAAMVDLSGMKRILWINRRNRVALVEPGVTYSHLQPELAKQGLRLTTPLLPRANKSVVASLLEREPTLIPRYLWAMHDPLRCVEVVWGDGFKMTTGNAGSMGTIEEEWEKNLAQVVPSGPQQTDFYKFVSAAQGSMGIVTWASVKCEVLPEVHKLFFVISIKLDNLIEFLYRVLWCRFADELFILNNWSLASIIGDGANQIKNLAEKLPPWIVFVGIAGRDRLPQERVEFQEKDIKEIAKQFDLQLLPSITGVDTNEVMEAILSPSRELHWKLGYKGGCRDIFFLTTLERAPEFVKTMYSVAEKCQYPASEIGVYIQPVHQGASCHCEFSLPFNQGNQQEVARMQELFAKASDELQKEGAFFSRPYGIWANMAFNRDAQTTIVLRKIKGIFDPNNIMNPGKLCF